jgi:hypothetical protein
MKVIIKKIDDFYINGPDDFTHEGTIEFPESYIFSNLIISERGYSESNVLEYLQEEFKKAVDELTEEYNNF